MRFLFCLLACCSLCEIGYSQACVDTDGDGWGWDGHASCRMALVCVDSDGDGWGWDGVKSCRTGAIQQTRCKDEDGDGWGWNGIESCKPGVNDEFIPLRLTLGINSQELNDDAYEPRENGARAPVVSNDGRYILFDTFADNVVDADTNAKNDVFLRDTVTGSIRRISQGVTGENANGHSAAEAVSTSGRFSVFTSYATNIVSDSNRGGAKLYLYDADLDVTKLISLGPEASGIYSDDKNALISSGGGDVFYESATNFSAECSDIRHYTVSSKTTRSILLQDQGVAAVASLRGLESGTVLYFCCSNEFSASGYFYTYDVRRQSTERLPYEVRVWDSAKLSANAKYIVFNIDGKSFLLDRDEPAGLEVRLPDSLAADISSNGRWLVFSKFGFSPVANTAGVINLFVQDLKSGAVFLLTKGLAGLGVNANVSFPTFTGFNNAITFSTSASNLEPNDENGTSDVYLYNFDAD